MEIELSESCNSKFDQCHPPSAVFATAPPRDFVQHSSRPDGRISVQTFESFNGPRAAGGRLKHFISCPATIASFQDAECFYATESFVSCTVRLRLSTQKRVAVLQFTSNEGLHLLSIE